MEVFFTTIILLTLYCKTHSGLQTTYGLQGALPNGDGVPNDYNNDDGGIEINQKHIFLFGKKLSIIKCNLYKLFYHNQPLDERISFLSFLDFHWNKNIVEMDNFASTKVNMQKKFEEKLNILMQ